MFINSLLIQSSICYPGSIYDNVREIARCLTEIYSSLKFCQPVIFGDFLSDTDEFLSPLLNFCQTLKVTLTVCCSVNVRSHV